jgi:hypothetical protein
MSDRDRELPPGRLTDLRLAWAGAKWRARLRRKIEIQRYRLGLRIGGWPLRESETELLELRAQLAEIRRLRTYSRSSMGRIYDYVKGVDLDRVLSPADFGDDS